VISKRKQILSVFFPMGDNKEVLSKLLALKNLLMNPPSHLPDDQRNDRVGDKDKEKEGDKNKDPQCKHFSVAYLYKEGLKH